MGLKNYYDKVATGIIAFILLLPSYGSSQTKGGMAEHQAAPQAKEIFDSRSGALNNFVFTDTAGRSVKLSDFKGKWVFADVWYSGCGACIHANEGIKIAHEAFLHQDIVFLSISIDKSREKWISSVTQGSKKSATNPWAGMYVPAKGTIMLYTSGSGDANDFRRTYVPKNRYPQLLLFDKNGDLTKDTPPRPDVEPEKLISFIQKQMAGEK